MDQCILCGNKKFKTVIKINNASSSVAKLLSKDQTERDKKMPLTLITCARCRLCQLERSNFVGRSYYNDYQMAVSYSKYMQAYQKWLARDFVEYFGLKGKSAFEIGCGDGMFAEFLCKKGLKTIGIEPSCSFYYLAKRKIKVLNQHFNKKTLLKKDFYDAIVARQLFEHLDNPNQTLQDVKLYLKPDGVGLIEVPSFSTAIGSNRYYDIFRDHVGYYTPYTLQYLLTLNNFQVIKIFHTADNEYLTAYFKNNEYSEESSFSVNYNKYKRSVKRFFSLYKNKRIAVWGAGGKGIALLSMCDIYPRNNLLLIDSDRYKWNKYTPGSHFRVVPPMEVEFDSIDLVVISAVMYQNEIIDDLRTRYNYRNEIAVLSPDPHIL